MSWVAAVAAVYSKESCCPHDAHNITKPIKTFLNTLSTSRKNPYDKVKVAKDCAVSFTCKHWDKLKLRKPELLPRASCESLSVNLGKLFFLTCLNRKCLTKQQVASCIYM